MLKDVDKELNWEEILVKFNSYEGKIIDFVEKIILAIINYITTSR
ncbi:hypothetical protein [Clostridium sp. UBA7503]